MSLGLAASSQTTTIEVGQQSDSGVRTQVDFAGEGSDSDVDPVFVEGCKFLA